MSAGIADTIVAGESATATVLREAQSAYEVATRRYFFERDTGGIVEADAYDREAGVKWRPATPEGATALYAWQRARAELEAAQRLRNAELRGRLL